MRSGRPQITPIEGIHAGHDIFQFHNGRHDILDEWLKAHALESEGLSARTYVACQAQSGHRVVGYYAISASMEQRDMLPTAKLRRNMPEQVPLLLIGRLAVDAEFQGYGIGTDLLSHALRQCAKFSQIAGVRAVVAHAIDDEAVRFYEYNGFRLSNLGERQMVMPIETVRTIFPD